MTARTHDAAAFCLLTAVFIAVPPASISLATIILCILANLIGGIAPDIDQPTAPFWRNLPVGRYVGRVFGALSGGHRFLSHSLVGLGLFSFAVHWLLVFLQPVMPSVNVGYVTWSFILGMLSHLIMDSITKEGVPWLLPIPFKFGFPPLRKLRVTTGNWIEAIIIFPAVIAGTLWLIFADYNYVLQLLRTTVIH